MYFSILDHKPSCFILLSTRRKINFPDSKAGQVKIFWWARLETDSEIVISSARRTSHWRLCGAIQHSLWKVVLHVFNVSIRVMFILIGRAVKLPSFHHLIALVKPQDDTCYCVRIAAGFFQYIDRTADVEILAEIDSIIEENDCAEIPNPVSEPSMIVYCFRPSCGHVDSNETSLLHVFRAVKDLIISLHLPDR